MQIPKSRVKRYQIRTLKNPKDILAATRYHARNPNWHRYRREGDEAATVKFTVADFGAHPNAKR